MARLGVTLPVVALVWLFVLPTLWPPTWRWLLVLALVVVWGVSAFYLWLEYFEEQSIQKEIRERAKKVDKPGRPPSRQGEARHEERRPTTELPTWPPPPDQQSF